MEVESIASSEDLRDVMGLAIEQKLTFYDSSYLYAAKTKKRHFSRGDVVGLI
jgi:predicted nucleic acid-binding protein